MPNQIDAAARTLRAAAGWFCRHSDEISLLARQASQDATHQCEAHKALAELLIVFDQLVQADSEIAPSIRSLIEAIAQSIDHSFYAESIVRYPGRFRLYGSICGVLAKYTPHDALFANGLAVAQMGPAHTEASLMRSLDAHFVAKEYYATGSVTPEMLAAAKAFLCATHSPHILTNEYLYAYTHIVFYLTHLGRDLTSVRELNRWPIASLVQLYTSVCLAAGDFDLLSEFILCSLFVGAKPVPDSISSLSQAQMSDGSIPRYPTPTIPRREACFDEDRHTTLVASWALSEFIVSETRVGPPPSASVLRQSLFSRDAPAEDVLQKSEMRLMQVMAKCAGPMLELARTQKRTLDVATKIRLFELDAQISRFFGNESVLPISDLDPIAAVDLVRLADSIVRLRRASCQVIGNLKEEYLRISKYCVDQDALLHPIHVLRLWAQGLCSRPALLESIANWPARLGFPERVWHDITRYISGHDEERKFRFASEMASTLYIETCQRNLDSILEMIEICVNLRTADPELAKPLRDALWIILFPLASELVSHAVTAPGGGQGSRPRIEHELNCLVLAGRILDGLGSFRRL